MIMHYWWNATYIPSRNRGLAGIVSPLHTIIIIIIHMTVLVFWLKLVEKRLWFVTRMLIFSRFHFCMTCTRGIPTPPRVQYPHHRWRVREAYLHPRGCSIHYADDVYARHTYTPAGAVSTTQMYARHTYTPAGAVSTPQMTCTRGIPTPPRVQYPLHRCTRGIPTPPRVQYPLHRWRVREAYLHPRGCSIHYTDDVYVRHTYTPAGAVSTTQMTCTRGIPTPPRVQYPHHRCTRGIPTPPRVQYPLHRCCCWQLSCLL